tara:strand:- start:2340 stop:2735 length:396 start_codon:yes stop_codon:yes gene_type:complete
MNQFDNIEIDRASFAFGNLIGQDRWLPFTVTFGSLTVVGAPSYFGRFRVMGKKCEFQVKFSAATSIASVAGTDYLTLPIAAKGYSGIATMTNDTTNVAVGICHIDTSTSRCYLPAQTVSGNTFTIAGSYEI